MNNKVLNIIAAGIITAGIGMYNTSASDTSSITKVSANPSKSESFIKKLVFGNGFEYIIKFKYSPELSTTDSSGNTVYKRTVITLGDFFDSRKEGKAKKILVHKMKVIFTYDKNGHVWIDNPDEDISCSKGSLGEKKWKIIHNHEIFTSSSQCIVSGLYTLYKNPRMSRHAVYLDNSHIDVFCSPNGDIGFNSKAD